MDLTRRPGAGTLSQRVWVATRGVAAVGAVPLGIRPKLGLVRSKYLPAGLHAAEASYVSVSALSAFRAAIVWAVWSRRMSFASTPQVVLNMLDGPVGVDLALRVVWAQFRMIRRYLAYWPLEVPRIFRIMDLIVHGALGHGLVPLLMLMASEIGFVWDGALQGWIRSELLPFRTATRCSLVHVGPL